MENETPKDTKETKYFFKKFFIPLAPGFIPLVPGTVINVGIFIFLKPFSQPQWILLLIYCVTFIPQAIDSYTKIKLAEINADRQVKRDEIVSRSVGVSRCLI